MCKGCSMQKIYRNFSKNWRQEMQVPADITVVYDENQYMIVFFKNGEELGRFALPYVTEAEHIITNVNEFWRRLEKTLSIHNIVNMLDPYTEYNPNKERSSK